MESGSWELAFATRAAKIELIAQYPTPPESNREAGLTSLGVAENIGRRR